MTTPVSFRRQKDDAIIAIFPSVPWSPGLCASYEHVGQHGGASLTWVLLETYPATPEEYAPLLAELENLVGYDDLLVVGTPC